ncbi:MAG: undecaprenyldiphospho-muramoylpentapeptide beta-N- acetylglucosaminyltransferase [Candidatus Collierbacteria bacterium GW2011_GWB1_44_6]|uniref:Undecaprenyldiphospho-muramoylpentapeptide beta-N-acetylglucosaminyltransferase n=2 Tax=Candidatus Collieribacteriota TaxID=1752725 RepID=A0A0G1JQV2_9BACT|nr:MAG: undecaprenyldiphospho-muramoylpentapeptide beta-N- acetylglucosaminyltransferase [Candidatus Collierbacteria bacterium GW2011_GWC2_43_12]KKT73815.1 MAG: undecaprenyldiphospho-muramoylpentapeptide beta-N- acetylglucosaminyltransferase [Candidatus Collierbacteria bacterium GW2011_GWB1_44_6]KKT84066.1 MAG: undecaprenyldiphospho-muramoylpentapeptide beta-N- acetylglucosaminyltransferase [Microgenomates group bacterium GW2011_GWC1_44_9]
MIPLIAFTGGHHNSALEVAKVLQKEGLRLIWIGHKFTARGEKSLSAEYQEITRAGIKFLELKTGKFYRKIDPLEWLKIIFGFFQSFVYLLTYRPSLIYSSGGYLAVPVVISGWALRIPSITHEQTVVAGWANKAIAPFVKKILLTHNTSAGNFPKGKSVVVGLPIRKELLSKKYSKKFTPKLIYITCGKQGSHIINSALFPIIPKLAKTFTIVHQTGSSTLTKDLDRARRIKERLGVDKDRYIFAPYFFSEDAVTYIRSASIVVSRSGAHTIYELLLLRKKAVLIPISWVSHNEQLLNARLAQGQIGSSVLEEKDLSPESLYQAIIDLAKKPAKKPTIKLNTHAAEEIADIIRKTI